MAINLASKLDRALLARAQAAPARGARSRVIVRTLDGRPASALIEAVNGVPGRYFSWLGGQVAIVPDAALDRLARRPEVAGISLDRPVRGTMDRTATATGARWVTEHLGVTGLGVGVATIDSGVNPWHEDLDGRVVHFADFVNAQTFAYDDYGHGTHVAGIIAGNGRAAVETGAGAARGGPWRAPRRAEGARRHRQRLYEQRHRRHRLRDREPRDLQHPRPQPLGRRRRLRIVHQGSADARRQARRRLRHRRRRRRGQPRPRWRRTAAVRRHHLAGQRALGADRRRGERSRHGRSARRRRRRVQLARTGADRRERQARSRRAGRRTSSRRPIRRARSLPRIRPRACGARSRPGASPT